MSLSKDRGLVGLVMGLMVSHKASNELSFWAVWVSALEVSFLQPYNEIGLLTYELTHHYSMGHTSSPVRIAKLLKFYQCTITTGGFHNGSTLFAPFGSRLIRLSQIVKTCQSLLPGLWEC